MSKPRVLLVTLAIGEKYLSIYNTLFRPSHAAYAARHGYDFQVVIDFLSQQHTHQSTISFHKILVASKNLSYDYVIFIDADILIHPHAPPIHTAHDFGDNIGIVDEYSQPTPQQRIEIQNRMGWETSATEYYALCGFSLTTPYVLNTGVLVIQPKKHAPLLETIFSTYVTRSIGHPRGFHFEQSAIGYELQIQKMYTILPNAWNLVWGLWKEKGNTLEQVYHRLSYFLHFAGNIDFDKIPELLLTSPPPPPPRRSPSPPHHTSGGKFISEITGAVAAARNREIHILGVDTPVDRSSSKVVDFIKLDKIEGAEILAKQGATRIIQDHTPVIFFERNHTVADEAVTQARTRLEDLPMIAGRYHIPAVSLPDDNFVLIPRVTSDFAAGRALQSGSWRLSSGGSGDIQVASMSTVGGGFWFVSEGKYKSGIFALSGTVVIGFFVTIGEIWYGTVTNQGTKITWNNQTEWERTTAASELPLSAR